MNEEQIDDLLRRTIADFRVSRGEKKLLAALMKEMGHDEHRLAYLRHRAFEIARKELISPHPKQILDWLEDLVKALQPPAKVAMPDVEVYFSPGDECRTCIVNHLNKARRQVDICVFTITDDRITRAIEKAHDRGVRVRIISDNDKSEDRGSDIDRLEQAGVSVVVDQTDHHMHHKFAVFDGRVVLTGSYNWTRSAALHNSENFLITADNYLVGQFRKAFQRLWDSLR